METDLRVLEGGNDSDAHFLFRRAPDPDPPASPRDRIWTTAVTSCDLGVSLSKCVTSLKRRKVIKTSDES